MTVIRFPDRQRSGDAEGQNRFFSGFCEAEEELQLRESEPESHRPALGSDNEAVRHFALMIADKLLRDPEFNHAAPFMVDKIIRLLVSESGFRAGPNAKKQTPTLAAPAEQQSYAACVLSPLPAADQTGV
ncbi:hypothetical protein [Enterobacter cloacae]|uniref:hypothetical protein n=1 Tax=Enterobacter cloacae TaxID=550 RepID=UPI00300C29FA